MMTSFHTKLRMTILAAVLSGGLLSACAPRETEVLLRVRHGAPPTMPMHRALLKVASILQERSRGRIHLLVEAGLSLPYQIDEMLKGSDEISMSGMGSLSDYYPPLGALEAPYMFRDVDHFYHTVETPFWGSLVTEVERRSGLHVIDMWHQGVRQVTFRDQAARSPAEFGRIKLRVPPSQMYVECARVLGALPTTMNINDVRTAIRAGTVDGQENPLPTIEAMHFHDVCTYLVLTNHSITPIMPIVSAAFWKTLSESDRLLITEAFREGGRYNRKIVEEEERELIHEFEQSGMIVIRPDLRQFRDRAEKVWKRYGEVWGDSLVARIQAVK